MKKVIMKFRKGYLLGILFILVGVGIVAGFITAAAQPPTLTAVKVTIPPKLDGSDTDEAWKKAQALQVLVFGGKVGTLNVTMKAVYTDKEVYLLAKWPDKTMNVEHHPYIFDGTKWTKTEEPLEDRFAIQWNISVPAFPQAGCAVLCHSGAAYPDKKPRMHTNAPGEFTDEWHWKAARSNPMGYVDDKYVDNTVKPDDDEAGHHADGGVRVYTGNKLKEGVPGFVWKGAPGTPPAVPAGLAKLFLIDTDKAAYGPINALTGKPWAKGDKVPVAVLQNPSGSNSDIKAFGAWKDGFWTLEMSRALDTGANAIKGENRLDVVFDPAKTYHFGISVFDNAEAGDHSYSGPLSLVFK